VGNFNSGANVEELGGVGSERLPESAIPSPEAGLAAVAPEVVSSLVSIKHDGLGVLVGGPWNVGTKDIRTLFFRRWPWRAAGLPFSADGFPVEDSGVGSHWKGLPPLLREDVCECCRFGDRLTPLRTREVGLLRFCRSGDPSEYACALDLRFGVEKASTAGGLVVDADTWSVAPEYSPPLTFGDSVLDSSICVLLSST
jgi:hypothetical protein